MSTTSAQKSTASKIPAVSKAAGIGAAVLTVLSVLAGQSAAFAAEAPVGLGTAASYSVLGGQTVTNTGPSRLNADLGVSPGSEITGFPPGLAGGSVNLANAQAAQAQADVVIAYDDAAGRAPTESVAGDLVGRTLGPGVYNSTGPLALSGTLTLDAQGDPNAVFIFQAADTLITASASSVNLIGGAQACNVYWQVGSSATLGTNSSFMGTILALTSITATTNTVVEGRALARNGSVTLEDNTFTAPNCAPAPTASAPPSAPSAPTATPEPGAATGADEAPGTNRGTNIDSAGSSAEPSAIAIATGIAAVILALVAGVTAAARRTPRKH
ncbi:ice-binding family protein [Arthrobacter sp. zg-Y877]|uniref:ice-binding family protein n=1 Tax=Arthrobacter sp. zg-Y877 TaxID=3049074 RepID=UPI0025A333FB|nr:ice-binding family protein [Arthrobacter sp. zg-Y877]MDM7989007.1 ice-binding family protein [Arthrobacter sp. zg-Y877]